MAELPVSPPPSAIILSAIQPTAKSRSLNGVGTQVRSSGIFQWEAKISYELLEFSERDEIMAFLIAQKGQFSEFDVLLPTHSENNSVFNSTATAAAEYAAKVDTITLSGMTGELKPMNLLRVSGEKATYAVVSAGPNVAGDQTVTIMPPLRKLIPASAVIITKNVKMNMSLEKDSISSSSKGMQSSISFILVEEVL